MAPLQTTACAVVAAVAVAALAVPMPAHAATGQLNAKAVVVALAKGHAVIARGAIVRGTLDFRHETDISAVFVCEQCTFERRIVAPHVLFRRGIDLAGSILQGDADFVGARFMEPALFDGDRFLRRADFGFATFDDLVSFEGAHFGRAATFSSARFRAARFGGPAAEDPTTFQTIARFDAAVFSGDTSFASVVFAETDFNNAVFGAASDFRRASFFGPANFSAAAFHQAAEFGRATFAARTAFEDARFAGDALFGGASFQSARPPTLSFDHAVVGGLLSLDTAGLGGSVNFSMATAQRVSLDAVDYDGEPPTQLYIDDFAAREVSLDLADLPHLTGRPEEQQRILHRAEATAKASGDLALANDLHYRLQLLASDDDGVVRRILDIGLYRLVAGYFVRPFRPLFWLLGIVLAAAAVRALTGQRPHRTDAEPGILGRAGRRFVRALTVTINPRSHEDDPTPVLRRLELSTYAVLLAAFMLGIANTNPTLRDMVEALF